MKKMKKIKKEELDLRIGDYIFTYNENEFVSSTIAEFSCKDDKHKVSHISCVADNQCVIEALGNKGIGKVVRNTIEDTINRSTKIYIAKPKIDSILSDKDYLKFLNSKINKKYDYKNIFSTQIFKLLFGHTIFGGQRTANQADDKYICSELGAESMNKRYGILKYWYRSQPNPNELFKLFGHFDYFEVI